MRLTSKHSWIIGLVAAFVVLVTTTLLISLHQYHQESEHQARALVATIRSLPGPLYAVEEPTTAAEVIADVQTDNVVDGVATYGVVIRSIGETSVQSTWPGGDPESCVPGRSYEPDYTSTEVGPDGQPPNSDVPIYTACIRLSRDAVVGLYSGAPSSSAPTSKVEYAALFATFGRTTVQATLESERVLTRADAVARARAVLGRLHPLDLTRYSDAELLGAARDQVGTDRMF